MSKSEYFDNTLGKRVLLIGDAEVDKYIIGVTTRLRPESHIPIIDINETNTYLGHLGIVLKYLLGFGGEIETCTVVGDDFEGSFFTTEIEKLGVNISGICHEKIATPQITRVKSWGQHVVQLEKRYEFSPELRTNINHQLLEYIKSVIYDVDVIVLLDYGLGIFNQNYVFVNNVLTFANNAGKKVIVSAEAGNYQLFSDGYLIEINLNSAATILGITQINETSVRIIGSKILNDTRFEGLFLSSLFENSFYLSGENITFIPNIVPRPVDNWAGLVDAEISAIALLIAAGAPQEISVKVANFAGALSTTKPNITYFPMEELQEVFERGEINR
jgi:rfaE bifunctional protein kinase chain/domain